MATSREATAHAAEQRRLIDAAERGLTAWLAANVAPTPDEVVQFMLALVGQFANATAEHAAAWYSALRQRAADRESGQRPTRFGRGGAPNFVPTPVDAFDAGSIARDTRWALDQADPAASLAQVVDQHVAQAGKDTISVNAENDPAKPRWARMPVGLTCAWCLMLASRGAAYASRQTAGYDADGRKYHADDDCVPVPVWDDRDLPYDAEALYRVYRDARSKAGSDPTRIAAQIRRDHWDTVTDGVPPDDPPESFYLHRSLHPQYWDRRQDAIGLDFKGEELKPIEILSVERLVRLGQDIEWIENDQTTATSDFFWGDKGVEVEMKSLLPSTTLDLKRIRRPIVESADSAWRNHQVIKDKFLVDVSPRPLTSSLRAELEQLVGTEMNGVQINRLWILSSAGLEEIQRK